MQAFLNKNTELTTLTENPFKLEKEVKTLFEKNLETIDNLKFVKSEYQIEDYCIDTLAYDTLANAFVIIKYISEGDSNINIVDQGTTYIKLLLENKFDLFILYTESCDPNLQAKQIEWSQSRVIFVSTAFSPAQIEYANSSDLDIDLWEVKQFEQNMILINRIKTSKPTPSIKKVQLYKADITDITINRTDNETAVYNEESHFVRRSDNIIELYKSFRDAILSLSDKLKVNPKKVSINFYQDKTPILVVYISINSINIYLDVKNIILNDPRNFAIDVSDTRKKSIGNYRIIMEDTSNLEYIVGLVKQLL